MANATVESLSVTARLWQQMRQLAICPAMVIQARSVVVQLASVFMSRKTYSLSSHVAARHRILHQALRHTRLRPRLQALRRALIPLPRRPPRLLLPLSAQLPARPHQTVNTRLENGALTPFLTGMTRRAVSSLDLNACSRALVVS